MIRTASFAPGLGAVWLFMVGSACAADVPCPKVPPQAIYLPAMRTALAHRAPVTIVAFGSSSTEGVGASAPDRTYPARLEVALRAQWPEMILRVWNRGIGGETTEMMLTRLNTDVLAIRPALVIWQLGANEALRGVDPATMAAPLHDGLRRLVAAGADVVLMDNQQSPRMMAAGNQAAFLAVLRHEVVIPEVSLFSRTRLMHEWAATSVSGAPMIGQDGIHHTDHGYECLAQALAASIIASATAIATQHSGP